MQKNIWTKVGFILSIVLWCAITLIRIFHHTPWYDEAHAWTIAQELNIFELFKFLKTEGHTFLWYVLLMPFAKTNFMYPYSMQLLNWIFCFSALLIFWLKAPFNNWVKCFITFSFPFVAVYSVLARCYAIGILFLFILISMDKDKLKHPNWYSFLLILLANTSLMGSVPAAVLGVRFAYEMIKNKQKLIIPFSIAIFGAILVLLPLVGSVDAGLSAYQTKRSLFVAIYTHLTYNSFYVWTFYSLISLSLAIVFYIKNKIFPTFFFFSMLLLTGIFCIYSGSLWHLFFMYIYFISSCWLIFQKEDLKCKNLITLALIVISIPSLIYHPVKKDADIVYKNNIGHIVEEIQHDKGLENSTIMIFRQFDTAIQPYFYKKDITLVNYCSADLLGYNTIDYVNSKNCLLDLVLENQLISLDNKVFDKWYNDNLYLLTLNKIQLNDNGSNKLNYQFSLYKDYGRNYLWKVKKIR